MGHAVELRANRPVDLRHAMPVDVAPQRRHAVEIPPSVGVDQIKPVRIADNGRLLAAMLPHRRKRVPDMGVIKLSQFIGRHASDY
jgi:hypothetical protein